MFDFWETNWGDVASVVGIIVSLVGLGWAIKEAHGAKSAATAAQLAANETRDRIARHLQTVDLQRAIGLIERIKTLHDNERWQASREHYQTPRAMLSDVITRCPASDTTTREKLANSRIAIRTIEGLVSQRGSRDMSEDERSSFNRILNATQSDLEELASSIGFGGS